MLHRIHVTGIFTYMKTIKNSTIHGKYTSPMDPMGTDLVVKKQMHWKKAKLGNSAEWLFLGWLSQVTPSMGPPTIEGSKGHGLNYPQNMYFFGLFGCFLNWWYPQNTPKLTFLVEKPMSCQWFPGTYEPYYVFPFSGSFHPQVLQIPSLKI